MPAEKGWHALQKEEVLRKLGSSLKGLSEKEAQKRLQEHGPNSLEVKKRLNLVKLFLAQFKSILIIILIFAALALLFIGLYYGEKEELLNAGLILFIVVVNGLFGFFQNFKAEKSIQELKKMAVPKCVVQRNGELQKINSTELVPGDVVLLEEGDLVPADLRIYETSELEIDESLLTGESEPVQKKEFAVRQETILAERACMAYMSTRVVKGKGKGVIVETAKGTEVGKIAEQMLSVEEKPGGFGQEMDRLGTKIGIAIGAIIAVIAAVQWFMHAGSVVEIFVIAVALAVAAIPEGLPAIMTIALALGTRKMVKKNSLVRKLSVVEELGAVDVICSDKTGTITEGKMSAREVYFYGRKMDAEKKLDKGETEIDLLLKTAVLCNDAKRIGGKMSGNYTEIALLEFAYAQGIEKKGLEERFPRTGEIGFTHERKKMSTIHKFGEEEWMLSKGALERVLNNCSRFFEEGEVKTLTRKAKSEIIMREDEMASRALRVLAFAAKKVETKGDKEERGMIFLGMAGLRDSPRKGVKKALQLCRDAGISVKVITGDKALTAKAIAKEIGIPGEAMEGKELDNFPDEELKKKVEKVDIFARVEPRHKVRILQMLQKNGHVVAMTGDGVNDAPALKNAEVGIAMGIRGTEVAKEASDLVLLDDNFESIVDAVKEGRTIFSNIKKFVNYLLTTNFAEVFVVFLASLHGLLPITAVQLLIINFVTDGFPALALGVDPSCPGIMEKKPRQKGAGVIDKRMGYIIGAVGLKISLVILVLFFAALPQGLTSAQTMVFAAFIVFEFSRIVVIRSQEKLSFFSNKWLIIAIAASLALMAVLIYSPANAVLGMVPFGLMNWGMLLLGAGVVWVGAMVISRMVSRLVKEPAV